MMLLVRIPYPRPQTLVSCMIYSLISASLLFSGGEIMAALWDQWQQRRKPQFEPTTGDNLLPDRQADESV